MSLSVGLLCHDGVGGSARIAMDLGAALGSRGHDVHVFSRHAPFGMAEPPERVSFHTLAAGGGRRAASPALDADWPAARIDAMARRVASVARGVSLDVLHFHYAVPFAWVGENVVARMGTTAPALVGTLHGTDVSVLGRRPDTQWALAATLPRLDGLTTVSADHAALAARTFGLQHEPEVIPNFIDTARFRTVFRSSRERRRPSIVHVSNFRAVKHPQAVARIFAEVRRRADAELWLVGDGEGMPEVRESLDAAGLLDDVRFFGRRLDVERILPEADVMLVTSRAESFCMAALEAGSCGVPVVAPRVGGLADTVTHGHTGELFDAGDEAAAADAVVRLLSDQNLRLRMGSAARWRAHQLSTSAVVPRYEELYRRVLDARRPADIEATPAA